MLNYEYPPLGGGAGNAMMYLLQEFATIPDVWVDVITSSTGAAHIEHIGERITIYALDIKKNNQLHHQSTSDLLRYSWQARHQVKRLLNEHRYDGIHAWFGIPSGVIARAMNLPYIVSLRGSDVPFYNERFLWHDRLLFKRLSRSVWRSAAAVVANSSDLKNLALQSAPDQPITLIPNGVDTNEFQPNHRSNQPFTVISTSRLLERKGVRYLLDGFIKFSQQAPEAKLILIGSGKLEQVLRRQASAAGCSERIQFIGNVDHREIAGWYQQADVFVLPSLNEGMSNSLLEAMASGLAVIATDTGGVDELLPAPDHMPIPMRDSDAICQCLHRLWLDQVLRSQLSQAARTRALRYDWSQVAADTLALYQKYF